jgi:hypothetical protein
MGNEHAWWITLYISKNNCLSIYYIYIYIYILVITAIIIIIIISIDHFCCRRHRIRLYTKEKRLVCHIIRNCQMLVYTQLYENHNIPEALSGFFVFLRWSGWGCSTVGKGVYISSFGCTGLRGEWRRTTGNKIK